MIFFKIFYSYYNLFDIEFLINDYIVCMWKYELFYDIQLLKDISRMKYLDTECLCILFYKLNDMWKGLEMKSNPLRRASRDMGRLWSFLSRVNINMNTNKWTQFHRQADNNNSGCCFYIMTHMSRCCICIKFKNSSKMQFLTSLC